MTAEEKSKIAARVRSVVATELVVDVSRCTDETSLKYLGADDLDFVMIVMALEEEFGMEIPDVEADLGTTIGKAIEIMTSLLDSKNGQKEEKAQEA